MMNVFVTPFFEEGKTKTKQKKSVVNVGIKWDITEPAAAYVMNYEPPYISLDNKLFHYDIMEQKERIQ